MLGETVLIAQPVEEQVSKDVIAHSPGPLRRTNSRLFHRTRKRLRHPDVDHTTGIGINSWPLSVDERCEDALLFGAIFGLGTIFQQHTITGVASQIAVNIVSREKHESVQPRKSHLI